MKLGTRIGVFAKSMGTKLFPVNNVEKLEYAIEKQEDWYDEAETNHCKAKAVLEDLQSKVKEGEKLTKTILDRSKKLNPENPSEKEQLKSYHEHYEGTLAELKAYRDCLQTQQEIVTEQESVLKKSKSELSTMKRKLNVIKTKEDYSKSVDTFCGAKAYKNKINLSETEDEVNINYLTKKNKIKAMTKKVDLTTEFASDTFDDFMKKLSEEQDDTQDD